MHRGSFSEDAKGGGRSSNARLLLPGLLQLGRYYASQCYSAELAPHRALLAQCCSASNSGSSSDGAGSSGGGTGSSSSSSSSSKDVGQGAGNDAGSSASSTSPGAVDAVAAMPHVLALSLLLQSPEEWRAARKVLLRHCIRHGMQQWLASHPQQQLLQQGEQQPLPDDVLFEAAAPMLRLFGLVDWIQGWVKRGSSIPIASKGSSTSSSASASGWQAAMDARLQDLGSCAEAAEQLLEQLEEMEGADGAQELLDVMGLLGEVLSGACGSCEQFVRDTSQGTPAAG